MVPVKLCPSCDARTVAPNRRDRRQYERRYGTRATVLILHADDCPLGEGGVPGGWYLTKMSGGVR